MGRLKYNKSYDNFNNIDIIDSDLKKQRRHQKPKARYIVYVGTFAHFYKNEKGYMFVFKNIINTITGEVFKDKHIFLFRNTRCFKQLKGGIVYKFKAIPCQNENSYKYFKKYCNFIPLAN